MGRSGRFWDRKDACGVRLLPVQGPFCKEALLNEESCVIRTEQAGDQHHQVITDNTTVMTISPVHSARHSASVGGYKASLQEVSSGWWWG